MQRPFCAIFHTKRPILAHAAAILYDFSYKTPAFEPRNDRFV
jgi:hypothetical protein